MEIITYFLILFKLTIKLTLAHTLIIHGRGVAVLFLVGRELQSRAMCLY